MSKNIVIFSDGTGQEGGVGNNTNVYDLFNLIEDRTERQISFYDRGLGTGVTKAGSISGLGISRNIKEAYQFLSDTFSAGDRIYLFGFSRGATTVRTLSAFLHLFGILPRSRPELIERAWKIYKMRDGNERRREANKFVHRNHTMWTKIQFLGVWDTVAALGLPSQNLNVIVDWIPFLRHSFHDLTLSKSVSYARHALAIDDERRIFHPQLWDETAEEATQSLDDDLEPFETEDISDIFLLAEKLKEPDHPITRRLPLSDKTRKLLGRFDPTGTRRASRKKIEELERAVVADFNVAVYNAERSLYEPASEGEYEGIHLSPESWRRIARFRRLRKSEHRALDRLLLEDAYALRPGRIPRIKQVWFAGMHTDVGGGYAENELAHIPLLWMIREAIDLGLLIYPGHKVDLHPNDAGMMHDSCAGLGFWYPRGQRTWDPAKNQGRPPLVHESVIMRSRRDDPHYDPWILKMKCDQEPWPERLRTSIQFDDYHIWREAFWGWNGAFAVPWGAVERISCDEQLQTITLHMKGGRQDLVLRGCLPSSLPNLVAELERRREHKRLEEEDQRLRSQDERLDRLVAQLNEKVEQLERHIQIDDDQTAQLRREDEGLIERNRELSGEIRELKDQIAALERGVRGSGAEPADDSDSEVVEH